MLAERRLVDERGSKRVHHKSTLANGFNPALVYDGLSDEDMAEGEPKKFIKSAGELIPVLR